MKSFKKPSLQNKPFSIKKVGFSQYNFAEIHSPFSGIYSEQVEGFCFKDSQSGFSFLFFKFPFRFFGDATSEKGTGFFEIWI